MDPKVPILLVGIAFSPKRDEKGTTIHCLTPPAAPAKQWPVSQEPIEGDHPAHEDPSQMYRGMVYSNISNTAARSITVDSSASGSVSRSYLPSMWPENNFIMVSSVEDLEVSDRRPTWSPFATGLYLVSPNASKHINNTSTIKARRGFTRPKR